MSESPWPKDTPLKDLRAAIRAGRFTGHTAGYARGHVQGNVVILPKRWAFDFLAYCQRNPRPCPLLAVSSPGDPTLPELSEDLDIRTDVPRYRVFREGALVDEPTDIRDLWRDDLVTFVLGCSFSFEEALLDAGVPVRHLEQGSNAAMFRTNIMTRPAGPFRGELVVTMRPMPPAAAIRAVQITSRFPFAHGAPVHLAEPEAIGIEDLSRPDWGDAVEVRPGEIPVFWACGVTTQVAIANARPELTITHKPGSMLITDLKNAEMTTL